MKKFVIFLVMYLFCLFVVWGQEGDVEQENEYYSAGIKYFNSGDYDNALSCFEQMLNLYHEIYDDNHPLIAASYNNIGIVLNAKGIYKEALINHEKALEIRKNIYGEVHTLVAKSYNNIGKVLYTTENYEEALINYEKALEIYRTVHKKPHPDTADSYNNIGIVLYTKGDYEKALVNYEKFLEICRIIYGESHSKTADAYNNIGLVFDGKGDYEKALINHEKALKIRRNVYGEVHSRVANSYNNIGKVLYAKADYENALTNYEKALKIYKTVYTQPHSDTADLYNNIGVALYATGDYKKALNNYEKALEIRKVIFGDKHLKTADLYLSIGNTLYITNDYEKALVNYEKFLEICRIIYGESHSKTADAYNNIGLVFGGKGDYEKALINHEKALKIRRNVYGEVHSRVANSYNNIGKTLYAIGSYKKIVEYYQKAIDCYKKALNIYITVYNEFHPDIADSYNNIGVILRATGDYEKTLTCYEYAFAIYKTIFGDTHPQLATIYNNIGDVLDLKGDYEKALTYYEKALEIRKNVYGEKHFHTAKSYYNLGNTYLHMNNIELAYENFYHSIEFSHNSFSYYDVMNRMEALLSKSIKDGDLIELALKTGIDTAERARLDMSSMKTDVMRQSLPLYYYGVSFESSRGNAAKAFEYSEGLRNRGFLDQLGTETALGLDGVTQEERDRIRSLIDEITAARNVMNQQADPQNEYNDARYRNAGDRLAKAEKELTALDEEIGKRLPAYAQLRNPQPVNADAAKNWCGDKRAVLEYILPPAGNDGLEASAYCIVITGNDIRAVPLDSSYDYAGAVAGLRDAVEKEQGLYAGKSAAIHRYRSALYEKLIQPVMQHIPGGTERLVIVPDGNLSALPFDILGNDVDGLLGERYAISFSPSVSVSVLKETASRTGFSMIGIGNAVYSGPSSGNGNRGSIQLQNAGRDDYTSVAEYYRKNVSEWSMLKGSGEELRNIKTLIFPGEKVDIYEQEKATEQVIKVLSRSGELAGYEQILMACHGYFNAAKPEMSVLVFSEASDKTGKTEEDGYLTADEIALLHMNAEFLNLSACQTALAVVRHGDGMTGLTRSCIIAGAENVGVTLWEVNDEAACQFQEYLYGFIKAGVPYPEAYRKAKMAMVKSDDWAEPVYWAAFVLYE